MHLYVLFSQKAIMPNTKPPKNPIPRVTSSKFHDHHTADDRQTLRQFVVDGGDLAPQNRRPPLPKPTATQAAIMVHRQFEVKARASDSCHVSSNITNRTRLYSFSFALIFLENSPAFAATTRKHTFKTSSVIGGEYLG